MSNNGWLWVTSYAVNAVWQVAVVALAGWGISRLVKRAGPELQHKIWVATLILATLAPATRVIRSDFARETLTSGAGASAAVLVDRVSTQQIALGGSDLVIPAAAVYLIAGVYLAILLCCFLRLCWVLYKTLALVREGDATPVETDYAGLWEASKARLGVRSAALLRSREVSGPVTAGLRRPVLLLPASVMEDYSRTEFVAAVSHECAHIKRDDFRKNVFYEMVGLLTVFHPVTWFIKSQIAETREMICDGMAAEQLPDRRTYALSLLQLAGRVGAATPVVSHAMGMFDSRILERRVMSLTTSMPRLGRIQRYFWSVSAILLISITAGGIGLMTRTVAAQTSQATVAAAKKEKAPDLDCTYYDKGVGTEGTCGRDRTDKSKYRCYLNADMAQSQPQIGCEWKVRRAEGLKK